ncbi:MAG: helix-turn-helix domain-containing protein [Alphaproteobacteria bacterium]|nr:helix-turn-helix domain-containing protein [Alphaproteobacteria bacterium]MDP7223475.1 helix-turn-helix domain-containing protein [Alphaproteobacteria bacterium]
MFDALSQETRLGVFRLLIKAGPAGLPAGTLSDTLGTPHNTMSFHLNHLSQAGILTSRREGRSVVYVANFDAIHALIGFMVKDCCSDDFSQMRQDKKNGCTIIELANCCQKQERKAQ